MNVLFFEVLSNCWIVILLMRMYFECIICQGLIGNRFLYKLLYFVVRDDVKQSCVVIIIIRCLKIVFVKFLLTATWMRHEYRQTLKLCT